MPAGALLLPLLLATPVSCSVGGNPPVRQEPAWNSRETRTLAVRACYACHSNETEWPWYTAVPLVSWLVGSDVYNGRAKLNFSEWDRPQKEAAESAETVLEGEMPPQGYMLLHPEARLSSAEKRALATGLEATLGPLGEGRKGERRGDRETKGDRQ